jgi:hypothetical protein
VLNDMLPEASTTESSSEASSSGAASDAADCETSTDPHELTWSYDFGASSVTVSHIHQLEALRYFSDGRRVIRETRLCRSQIQMKLSSSRSSLLQGYRCHLIRFLPRSCSSIRCSCINLLQMQFLRCQSISGQC